MRGKGLHEMAGNEKLLLYKVIGTKQPRLTSHAPLRVGFGETPMTYFCGQADITQL